MQTKSANKHHKNQIIVFVVDIIIIIISIMTFLSGSGDDVGSKVSVYHKLIHLNSPNASPSPFNPPLPLQNDAYIITIRSILQSYHVHLISIHNGIQK